MKNASSAAWPAANRAVYVPFQVVSPLVVTQLFHWNGSAVSGNIDIGIYSVDGRRIVSSGSTAQAGTSVLQLFDVTDTVLPAGSYYFALAIDNTTGTTTRTSITVTVARTLGFFQENSAFPLPATATFALANSTVVPVMGLTTQAVI